MRPTKNQPGAVWALLEEWARSHPLDPNQRQLANLLGVSDSLLSAWKYCQSMLQPPEMETISQQTGIKYDALARALREDMPRILENVQARRSTKTPPRGSREREAG